MRSTQSASTELVIPWRDMRLLWVRGRIRWKDVCCRAAFTETRSRHAHAVTYTRGEGMVFHGGRQAFMCPLLHWRRCKGKESQVSSAAIARREASQSLAEGEALRSGRPGFRSRPTTAGRCSVAAQVTEPLHALLYLTTGRMMMIKPTFLED